MHSTLLSTGLSLLPFVSAFPSTPFTTRDGTILSADGETVALAGTNWPGHGVTMLPEGLQHNSIANITSFIKRDLGMNTVRLTFAIEMVDDVFEEAEDQSLEGTLVSALGSENGTAVLAQILAANPELSADMTRLDVFDAVAAELARQELWIVLDNHISSAQWCCGANDGNTWFGDTDFNVANWQRGLGFMAEHAKDWTSLAAISLRNELRPPPEDSGAEPYTWPVWLDNMIPAADAIYANNTLPLIILSGLGYDTDISFLTRGRTIEGATFTPADYTFADRITYELHNYASDSGNCNSLKQSLINGGYGAMDPDNDDHPNKAPVLLTEFGFNQNDGSVEKIYAQCLREFLLEQPGGPGSWIQWVVSGSYYERQGIQGRVDPWGMLNEDFSAWSNQTVIDEYNRPWVADTLA